MVKRLSWVLLIPILLFGACSKPEMPQFVGIGNFNIESLGGNQSVVSADVTYYNQNKFDLKLRKADLDIYLADKYVGKTVLDTLIEIPKLDTFNVPVKITVDVKSLVSNAISALLFNQIKIKIQGTAKVGRSGFLMNLPVLYEGNQKVSF